MKNPSADTSAPRNQPPVHLLTTSCNVCALWRSWEVHVGLKMTFVSSAETNVSGITTIATIWISFTAFARYSSNAAVRMSPRPRCGIAPPPPALGGGGGGGAMPPSSNPDIPSPPQGFGERPDSTPARETVWDALGPLRPGRDPSRPAARAPATRDR